MIDTEGLEAIGAVGEWSGGLFKWFSTGCKFAARYGRDVTEQIRWAEGSVGVEDGGYDGRAGACSG